MTEEGNEPFERLLGELRSTLRIDIIGAFGVLPIVVVLFRRGSHGGEKNRRVGVVE
jgi:hypothetical protein